MFQTIREKKSLQLAVIAVSLVILALITVAVGTRAWMTNRRTLQTITKVQFSTLDLIGKDQGTLPVNLGEINIKETGSKEISFGILSEPDTKYSLQLGHTTNLPLTYKIYHVTGVNDEVRTEIEGGYLNQDENTKLAGDTYHTDTYGSDVKVKVQINAEPLYWLSKPGQCICGQSGLDTYVLEISWVAPQFDNDNVIDKETEMIYLTASLGGFVVNETT